MTVTDARTRFMRLQIERIDAIGLGVDENCSYMTHLRAAIADAKLDYVAGAATEIAAMRVDLDGFAHRGQTVVSN